MARALDRLHPVVDAMRDQHGHLDRGKDVADVNVPIQGLEHQGGAGARREAQERRELSTEARVHRVRRIAPRRKLVGHVLSSPLAVDLSEIFVPLLCAPLPRVVGRAQATGTGAVEHAGEDARGVGGREDRAEKSAVLGTEERRPLDPGGIHDCADLVHPRLKRRQVRLFDPIREAGAATVENDDSRERP